MGMYSWLSNPLKKRVIRELRTILTKHPRYRSSADNVQDKYSFDERPQRGIIINSTSAERIRLSADNYVGRLSSFVQLADVDGSPGTTIEWIRENSKLLEQFSLKRDVFPTPPGVYEIEILEIPNEGKSLPGQFMVDPVLSINDEPVLVFTTTGDREAQLTHGDIYPGSVRLWLDRRRALVPDVDFSVDSKTGQIQFLKEPPVGAMVFADYRIKEDKRGPFPFKSEEFNATVLPGVVLAFGDRAERCDKQAVVIASDRTDVADVFGGKFETTFELLVFSRDSEDRGKMSDFVIIQVLALQGLLAEEGIELLDISPGGETEEVYNETTDEHFYDSPVALTLRADWEIHVPLPIVLHRAELVSKTEEQERGFLDGSVVADLLRTGKFSDIAGATSFVGRPGGIGFERIR